MKSTIIGYSTIYFLFAINVIFIFSNLDLMTTNIYWWASRQYMIPNPYFELFIALIVDIVLIGLIAFFSPKYIKFWLIKSYFLFFVIIYQEYIYGLDAFYYYAEAIYNVDAYVNTSFAKFGTGESYLTPGTPFVIYLNHIFSYFVGESYFSLKVWNGFIGFVAVIIFYKTYRVIVSELKMKEDPLFIKVLFLFPTILLFSSHIGKDTINLFLVSLYIYGFIGYLKSKKFRFLVLVFMAIVSSYYIRIWWPIIFMLTLLLFYIRFNSVKNVLMFLVLSPVAVLMFMYFLSILGMTSFADIFMKMNDTVQNLSYGGSSTKTGQINGILDYLIFYIPNAFTALYRPLPFDISNPFIALSALENTFLLYLTYKYIYKQWKLILRVEYLKFLVIFIFSWTLFYSIISPGNMGMAIRFKLQVLPSLLIIIWISKQIYNIQLRKTK